MTKGSTEMPRVRLTGKYLPLYLKAALIHIFKLTMDEITAFSVKGVTHSIIIFSTLPLRSSVLVLFTSIVWFSSP